MLSTFLRLGKSEMICSESNHCIHPRPLYSILFGLGSVIKNYLKFTTNSKP